MRNAINLREEFEELLENYGHPVLMQRTSRDIRCRCFSEKYREADPDCPFCFGIGWVSRIERHKVRGKSSTQNTLGEQSEVGVQWQDSMMFYMKHDSHPKVGDKIYEVGWSEGQRPGQLNHSYKITDVNPQRVDDGRTEFWRVFARTETTNKSVQRILMRAIGPIKNYELLSE